MTSKKSTPPNYDPKTPRTTRAGWFDDAVGLYGVLLMALVCIRHGLGDRTSWSFALNSLFVHAFWPALPLLVVAILLRSRAGLIVSGLSTLVFLGHRADVGEGYA